MKESKTRFVDRYGIQRELTPFEFVLWGFAGLWIPLVFIFLFKLLELRG